MTTLTEQVQHTETVEASYRVCDGCGIRDWTPAQPGVTQPKEGWITAELYYPERFGDTVDFCCVPCARDFFAEEPG